jgi:hypothetical protein
MTVPTYNEEVIQGDGATLTFEFPFEITDADELKVTILHTLTGLLDELDSDEYTVAGAGDTIGGSVTLLVDPPSNNDRVILTHRPPYTQPTSIMNQGGMFPQAIEEALDETTRAVQNLSKELGRALRGPVGESWPELPGPVYRANKALFFNSLGLPNLGAEIANLSLAVSSAINHTPSQPNTYDHTLYQDLEWGRLTTLRFLNATQRLDPVTNDCWEGLQNMADFISGDNFNTSSVPYHEMNLSGKSYALSKTLELTGFQTGSGPRRGRVMLRYGSLIALGARASQLSNPEPLVQMHDNAQACGMEHVYVDCKGLCSGILVENTGGNSKIELVSNRVVNAYNPDLPLQEDHYSNLVDVGDGITQNWVSAAAVRRYETTTAHPYCCRLGALDTADSTANSMTARLSGNHFSNWEIGHAYEKQFKRRTAICLWLVASDCYVAGEFNNMSDALVGMLVEGHSNKIYSYHSSVAGKNIDYDEFDAPTSAVTTIGTENRDGVNYYHGLYHERTFWAHDQSFEIIGCSFPRNADSVDGNDACVILDASKVGDDLSQDNKLIFQLNTRGDFTPGVPLKWIKYREDGGFTWTRKTDFETGGGLLMFGSSTHHWAVGDAGGANVGRFDSNNADRAAIAQKAKDGTREAHWAVFENKLEARLKTLAGGAFATILSGDETGLNIAAPIQQSGIAISVSRQRRTTALAVTDATLVNVFSNVALIALKTYSFRAVLHVTADATDGHQYQAVGSGGLTASDIILEIVSVKNADGSQPLTAEKQHWPVLRARRVGRLIEP